MKKFRLPRCPYCGKKLNPLYSWYLKNQGEFLCPKCGGISNVILDPAAYIFGNGAVILALIGFLVTRIRGNVFDLMVLLWLVLPFFVFSVLCCFLVRLKKPILRKKPVEQPKGRQQGGKGRRAMPPAPPAPSAPPVSRISSAPPSGRAASPAELYKQGYTTQFTGPVSAGDGRKPDRDSPRSAVSQETIRFSPPERREP